MKLTYKRQLILTVLIIFLFNILTTVGKHWIFSSIGKCLCGLLWIVHPVMIHDAAMSKRERRLIRLAGGVMILWGVFSRSYFY